MTKLTRLFETIDLAHLLAAFRRRRMRQAIDRIRQAVPPVLRQDLGLDDQLS